MYNWTLQFCRRCSKSSIWICFFLVLVRLPLWGGLAFVFRTIWEVRLGDAKKLFHTLFAWHWSFVQHCRFLLLLVHRIVIYTIGLVMGAFWNWLLVWTSFVCCRTQHEMVASDPISPFWLSSSDSANALGTVGFKSSLSTSLVTISILSSKSLSESLSLSSVESRMISL